MIFTGKIYKNFCSNNICLAAILIVASFVVSCKDSDEPISSFVEEIKLSSFSFLAANNPSLNNDIHLTIEDDFLTGKLDISVDIQQLAGHRSVLSNCTNRPLAPIKLHKNVSDNLIGGSHIWNSPGDRLEA